MSLAYNVRHFPEGEHCTDAKSGDIILVRHSSFIAKCIRLGQKMRMRGVRRPYTWCNHAAVIVDGGPNACVIEQAGRGGQKVPLSTYVAENYAVITLDPHVTDADCIEEFAYTTIGDPYGWVTIAATIFYCFFGIRLDLGFGRWIICSQATSEAMKVGGVLIDPLFDQLPADIAIFLGVTENGTSPAPQAAYRRPR